MAQDQFKPTIASLAHKHELYPQESLVKVHVTPKSLVIGIPKEKELQEKRICLTPDSVGVLVSNGHEVIFESGAGLDASFTDRQYSDKGAKIVYSAKEAFEANIVLKVEPPSKEERDLLKPNTTLISAIQMANVLPDYINDLNKKKITAVAFEFIEDKAGLKPVVRTVSEIASMCIISIAGEYLSNSNNGKGIVFGGITGVPPIKVLILGAGTIGENVARVARQMGAEVQVYDNHHYKLRRLKKEIGEQIFTSIIDHSTLGREIQDADVVVGALRSEEGVSLCVVTEEMVASMKPGSLIIDASISQGGCFETSRLTSHEAPIFIKHDVIHYCVPNISSRVSNTATKALSYIFTPILLQIARFGGVEDMFVAKDWFKRGVYTYKGSLTNPNVAKKLNMQYKDIDLLMAIGLK